MPNEIMAEQAFKINMVRSAVNAIEGVRRNLQRDKAGEVETPVFLCLVLDGALLVPRVSP